MPYERGVSGNDKIKGFKEPSNGIPVIFEREPP
jgi:hypothetical protein